MKKVVEKIVSVEEIGEIICDKCGAKENIQDCNGTYIASFHHRFGFLSKRDMGSISFDLCEECLFNMLNEFKVQYDYKPFNNKE